MPLVLKVEALELLGDSWNLRREHAMLHQPVTHVVILPAPPPEVDAIPIYFFILLPCEYSYPTKEVLPRFRQGDMPRNVYIYCLERHMYTPFYTAQQ